MRNSVWRLTFFFERRYFHEFDRGTMRQKITIFKERNSVWSGATTFYENSFLLVNVNEIESLGHVAKEAGAVYGK